jgi:hypothetical protein
MIPNSISERFEGVLRLFFRSFDYGMGMYMGACDDETSKDTLRLLAL